MTYGYECEQDDSYYEEQKRFSELPHISLCPFAYKHNIGLIIDSPTGVAYCSQVGGGANNHRFREGLLMPLYIIARPETRLVNLFREHFVGPDWHGMCYKGIDIETANFIDSVLKQNSYLSDMSIRVNRDKLAYCMEAWIEVRFSFPRNRNDSDYYPQLDATTGILTWENSD